MNCGCASHQEEALKDKRREDTAKAYYSPEGGLQRTSSHSRNSFPVLLLLKQSAPSRRFR
jgi:hypothetical protein